MGFDEANEVLNFKQIFWDFRVQREEQLFNEINDENEFRITSPSPEDTDLKKRRRWRSRKLHKTAQGPVHLKEALERVILAVQTRIERKESLQEGDQDLTKLVVILEELFRSDFQAQEIVSSGLQRIIKTIISIFQERTKNQYEYHGKVLVSAQRVLRDVKKKIINYCLDYSDYLQSHTFAELDEKLKLARSFSIKSQGNQSSIMSQGNTTLDFDSSNFLDETLIMEANKPKKRRANYFKGAPLKKPISHKILCQKMAGRVHEKTKEKGMEWAMGLVEDFEAQIRYCYPKMENSYKKKIKTLYLVLKNKSVTLKILESLKGLRHFKFCNV